MNDLDRVDLKKRSKELDARETALKEKERLMEGVQKDFEVKLKVLSVQVESKNQELERIGAELVMEYDNNEREKSRLRSDIDKQTKSLQQLNDAIGEKNKALKQINLKQESTISRLDDIERKITERSKYLEDQEALIAQAIEEGNLRLHQLRFDAEQVENKKNEHLKDIITLQNDRGGLQDNISLLKGKLEKIERDFNERSIVLHDSLRSINEDIKEAKNNYQVIISEADKKLQFLETKEKELTVKSNLLDKKQEDIWAESRRLDSKKSIYGI
jgi:predicted  nucleic acid-binding Zn-ribbon protein